MGVISVSWLFYIKLSPLCSSEEGGSFWEQNHPGKCIIVGELGRRVETTAGTAD